MQGSPRLPAARCRHQRQPAGQAWGKVQAGVQAGAQAGVQGTAGPPPTWYLATVTKRAEPSASSNTL